MNRVKLLVIFLLITYHLPLTTYDLHAEGNKYSFSAMEKAFLDGRYQKSITQADGLIDERASNREEIYYVRALSELKLGRYQSARRSFQTMIARYSFSKRAFDACVGLGDSYYLEGDMDGAIKSYDKAISGFPKDENIAIAYFRLARCYAKIGNGARANEFFEKAKKAGPLSFESRTALKVEAVKEPIILLPQPAPGAGGEHSVQVGYFRTKGNAESLARSLRMRGYDAYVETSVSMEGKFYRTKVGHYKTAGEALKVSESLKDKGYSTKVCAGGVCQ